MRKATAAASPVKMSGVAETIVSLKRAVPGERGVEQAMEGPQRRMAGQQKNERREHERDRDGERPARRP